MKTRDSDMPPEEYWETFFDPSLVLWSLGLHQAQGGVVDVGAGYGTFALPAARLTGRQVVAIDIEPEAIDALARKARGEGLVTVKPLLRDVVGEGTGLSEASADIVLLFNILHCEEPMGLLDEAWRILRPGGRVGILHWRRDIPTPRGPNLDIRPSPERCAAWLSAANFDVVVEPRVLPPYHFGMVGRKPAAPSSAGMVNDGPYTVPGVDEH